jgi:hypothetical protein
MFLVHKPHGELVEVLTPENLYDPCLDRITGRSHCGEELQEPEAFIKSELIFPSGESLPQCWLDPNYRRRAA